MLAKNFILIKPKAMPLLIMLVCLHYGCGQVIENSWKPHAIALSYSKNGQIMNEVKETDSPFPSIKIDDGDNLEFHSFTCQLFPTSKTDKGVYIVQQENLPPIPEEALDAEMRILVTPPAHYGMWTEEYDDNDTLMTEWTPVQKEPWKTPGLKQPIVAKTKWYHLKIQAQVRRKGTEEIINVRPEWYLRFHTPGLLGH